tara:strand:+ start:6135 stop:7001 length:867 start_codon:yes stop_codon:yes gene_type:complete
MQWYLFAIGAAITSALGLVVEKEALLKEHAMEFVTVWGFFSFLLSLLLWPLVNLNVTFILLVKFYFASLVAGIGIYLVAKGIRHLEVSVASPLLSFGPMITLGLSFFFLKETVTSINGLGIFLIVIGAYYLESHTLSIHFIEPFKKLFSHRHTLYIFIGMLLFSLDVVIIKSILNTVDVYTFIFFYSGFMFINFFILIHIFHDGIKGIIHGIKNAGKWIFLAALLAFFTKLLYYNALALSKASLAYSVIKTNSFFATIIGGTLFHEHELHKRILASFIMVAGVFLVVL